MTPTSRIIELEQRIADLEEMIDKLKPKGAPQHWKEIWIDFRQKIVRCEKQLARKEAS
jgi:uncharacterized small protein (DUF1192 family)